MKIVGGHEINQIGNGNEAKISEQHGESKKPYEGLLGTIFIGVFVAVCAGGILYWLGWI